MIRFIKKIFKDSIKVKRIRNYASKCSLYLCICISWYNNISWFLVIKCWCQGGYRMIHIFFELSLKYNCAKFYHCEIWVTDFREGGDFLAPPIREQPRKCPSWIGLRIIFIFKQILCQEWNRSIELNTFPRSMKAANIAPVIKKDWTHKANYRLITSFF